MQGGQSQSLPQTRPPLKRGGIKSRELPATPAPSLQPSFQSETRDALLKATGAAATPGPGSVGTPPPYHPGPNILRDDGFVSGVEAATRPRPQEVVLPDKTEPEADSEAESESEPQMKPQMKSKAAPRSLARKSPAILTAAAAAAGPATATLRDGSSSGSSGGSGVDPRDIELARYAAQAAQAAKNRQAAIQATQAGIAQRQHEIGTLTQRAEALKREVVSLQAYLQGLGFGFSQPQQQQTVQQSAQQPQQLLQRAGAGAAGAGAAGAGAGRG